MALIIIMVADGAGVRVSGVKNSDSCCSKPFRPAVLNMGYVRNLVGYDRFKSV